MSSELPSRETFTEFWSRPDKLVLWIARLTLYFGGLIAYSVFAPALLASVLPVGAIVGIAIVIAFGIPMGYWQWFWNHYDKFLRCPKCRDWVGRDISGSLYGQSPKWRTVIETSRCVRCGQQMLRDDPMEEQNKALDTERRTTRVPMDG